jgi:hypothetical protein
MQKTILITLSALALGFSFNVMAGPEDTAEDGVPDPSVSQSSEQPPDSDDLKLNDGAGLR